ncbi:GH25 family lysozyme [Bifidobacterium mongoliense]|uniref:Glycoside hydrolase family protein n=2 Tax=Bifidobacterium mongoliense TaxID=518643 RepID=A0A087BZS6_9BIFI|nr:GH25 family lysozyme [Bifidobacterium mongoliense]KFI76526.1 glycoside hydrolase family protein [Bifidobacterium mongoliense DSM 21395]
MRKRKRFYGLMALLTAVMMLVAGTAYADVGFDAASYQGCYNAHAAVNAGARFSFIKLSEGTGYTNPYAGCQLTASRNAGLRLGAYHFADVAGLSPQAEADNFLNVARSQGLINAGVIPVLDWEPAGNLKANVAWAKTWLDTVAAAWGTKPLIYMSASTIHIADWTPVSSSDYGLWVAGYPKGYAGDRLRDPGSVPYSVSPWGFAAAWQYSSSGSVAGVGSAVDVDWFYGDAVTWAKYANAPIDTVTKPAVETPTTTVKPVQTTTTPTGDANALATAVIQGLYGNQPQREKLLGSRYAEVMAIVNQRLSGGASTASGYYVVRSGDYLSKVWPNNWRTIASLNGLRSPYTIYAGQRLKTSGTSGRSYVVRSGETLGSIARRLGVSQSSIRGYRSGNPNLIYPGEILNY